MKNCFICNNKFKDTTHNNIKKFCSKECRNKKYYNSPKSKILLKIRQEKYNKTEKSKLRSKKWYETKGKKIREQYRKSKIGKIVVKNAYKKWSKSEHGRLYNLIRSANRRALKLKATPKWSNINKIKEIYKNCPKGYHVDHIIPLKGKNVSGLHVYWNLQYLKYNINMSKSNKILDKNICW
jgi:hypothetical protein